MKKWEKIYKTKLIFNFEEFGEQGYEHWVEYADFEEPSLEELAKEWFEWGEEDQPVLIKARKGEILIQKIPEEWEGIKVKVITKQGKEKITILGKLYQERKIEEIWNWFLRRLFQQIKGEIINIKELKEFAKIFVSWKEIYKTILTMIDASDTILLDRGTIKRMVETLKKLKINPNEE